MRGHAGEHILVLDNGGGTCKIGFASADATCRVFPNAVGKVKGEKQSYIGDQLVEGVDISSLSLRRPADRGYVVNWDLQRQIWQRIFQVTAPNLVPQLCSRETESGMGELQVVFEDFNFGSMLPATAPLLSLHHWAVQNAGAAAAKAGTGLVIDAGFSFTHVAPIFHGMVLNGGVRRINLGGKALTNYFKELVSYRSINMMEETFLLDHIKEQVCFVSTDLAADFARIKAGQLKLDYVLPDGVKDLKGYVRAPLAPGERRDPNSHEQILTVGNERFVVPELIFRPSDIGAGQGGLAEAVVDAVSAVHPDLHAMLYSNIICTGGFVRCPGFKERLLLDLRPLVPDHFQVHVTVPENPITAAWQGGGAVGRTMYHQLAYTRADYDERGPSSLAHVFDHSN